MKNNEQIFENIMAQILSPEIQFVSFDVFGTLIKMPFSKLEHLYFLIDKYYEHEIYSNTCFHTLRINSNRIALEKNKSCIFAQEITLKEIYNVLSANYNIETKLCSFLKKTEEDLLLYFSRPRETIKKLYDLALNHGKKIIVIIDTNYDKEIIAKLLFKNGFKDYENIFVSSELRKSKCSGELYKYVLEHYSILPAQLFHFGSDYSYDYIMPKKLGIYAIHIPQTFEQLCSTTDQSLCGELINYNYLFNSIGFGCLATIAANFYFDNPFRSFDDHSNLNGDPYYMGYYILGMHIVGIVKWIIRETKSYETILFMSRDGLIIKEAYDIITQNSEHYPKSKYIHISRKMMLPYILNTYADLIEFPSLDIENTRPIDVFEILNFCTKEISDEEKNQFCNELSLSVGGYFKSNAHYQKFITAYYKKLYDKNKHEQSRALLSKYFEDIGDKDITFDLGNFGRVQSALIKATGKIIDALFIFSDSEKSMSETRKNQYTIKTFYDFYPNNHRSFREYILSSNELSCVGVKLHDKQVVPIYETREKDNNEVYVKNKLHDGALQFVKDYFDTFKEYLDDITFKPFEVSLPFEAYLRNASSSDLKIFERLYFDKMLNRRDKTIVSIINRFKNST